MQRTVIPLIVLIFLGAWVIGLFWMLRRFRKTWTMLKSGQLKGTPEQIKAAFDQLKAQSTGKAMSPRSSQMPPDAPRTNAMGIVTETLEESLAKHRKKMELELAQLMKRQDQIK